MNRRTVLGGLAGTAAWAVAGCNRAERKSAGASTASGVTHPAGPPVKEPQVVSTPEPTPEPASPVKAKPLLRERGAIVRVQNAHALDRLGQPATEPAAKMVHRAVMELTGTSSPRDAWSKIVSPTDIVGIKPNCFAPRICPVHPATTDPVALDRLAWDTIDRVRKDRGLPLLMERNTGSRRRPRGRPQHVLTAGGLGLGESDFSKIKVVAQTLG